jgi:hypothetical protein
MNNSAIPVYLAICFMACATATPTATVVRPSTPVDAAYSCAMAAVAREGLTVVTSDRPSLIRAEQAINAPLAGPAFRVMTITIHEDSGTVLRVVPQVERTTFEGSRVPVSAIRDEDNAMAARLARACG